jgi:O-antigen/teichoic acid export membrane protein
MSRYLISAVEQALWSVLNFGVNLLLIRFVAPDQYGAFVFWASCGFVLSSLQNALTVCHLQALAPGEGLDPKRLPVERLMHGVNAVFLMMTALACLGGAMAWRSVGSPYGALAAALFVPAFLLQQYLRALAFSRGRADMATGQTAGVFVLVALLLGEVLLRGERLDADGILWRLGVAYGVTGALGAIWALRGQGGRLRRHELKAYGDYVRQSGWVFLGVSSTELLTRFYVFVVAGWFGAAALAALSATQQLLRPVPLLAMSWSMVARNDLARRRDQEAWSDFVRILAVAMGGGLAVAAVWTLILHLTWPMIATHLFAGKYLADGWMVALWGVSAALTLGQTVVSTGLQVLRAFKPLALANGAASLVAAAGILLIMRGLGPAGAIIGTAAGQLLELAAMTAILLSITAARRRSAPREA